MMSLPLKLQQWRIDAFRRENVTFSKIDDWSEISAIMLANLQWRAVKCYGALTAHAWQSRHRITSCIRTKT